MSIGTSLRGKSYENNFKNGFLHKNSAIMENGDFHSSTDSTIYDHTRSDGSNKMRKIPVGDIDAAFINTQVVKVVDLLPVESFLHDRAFQIEANSLIFFELATTEGANLFKNDYMEKKIAFHKNLKEGKFHDSKPIPKHVLVFCFNGADHVGITKKFCDLCKRYEVTGISVYLPSTAVEQWDLSLTAGEQTALAEEQTALAEKYAAKAQKQTALVEEQTALAEKYAAKAKKKAAKAQKNKVVADSRFLVIVKLLQQSNANGPDDQRGSDRQSDTQVRRTFAIRNNNLIVLIAWALFNVKSKRFLWV